MKPLDIIILCRPSQKKLNEELIPAMWIKELSRKMPVNACCLSMERETKKSDYEIYFDYGIKKVYLLSDSQFSGADTYATSYILAQSIIGLDIKYDLILANTISCYGETGHVPIQVAAFLGLPFGVNAVSLLPTDSGITCKQLFKSYEESIMLNYPCLISLGPSADKDFILQNRPTLFDMSSSNGEVKVISQKDLQINPTKCGTLGSHTAVANSVKLTNKKSHKVFDSTDITAASKLHQLIIGAF